MKIIICPQGNQLAGFFRGFGDLDWGNLPFGMRFATFCYEERRGDGKDWSVSGVDATVSSCGGYTRTSVRLVYLSKKIRT